MNSIGAFPLRVIFMNIKKNSFYCINTIKTINQDRSAASPQQKTDFDRLSRQKRTEFDLGRNILYFQKEHDGFF